MRKASEMMSIVKSIGKDIYQGTKKLLRGKLERKVPVYVPVLQGKMLEGRTALITGGTSGIGKAIAEAFLRHGAEVVITGRNQNRLLRACEDLEKTVAHVNDRIHGVVMDSSKVDTFSAAFADIQRKIQGRKLNILVNNAGLSRGGSIGDVCEEDYDLTLDTNLKGTYFLSQLVSEYMVHEHIQGNILNIASSSSLRPAVSPYILSKWGIKGLTLGLAKKFTAYGIVVNGLAPGPTATPLLLGDDTGHLESDTTPNGRMAAPEEIANMAVILTSSLGRTVIGDIVYMTCGSGVITVDDVGY